MSSHMIAEFDDCYFYEDGSIFILGNEVIERRWSVEGGAFITMGLKNKATGKEWGHPSWLRCKEGTVDGEPFCDFSFEGLIGMKRKERLSFHPLRLEDVTFEKEVASSRTHPRLKVTFHLLNPHSGTRVKRHYVIYPGTAAILTWAEIISENAPSGDYFTGGRHNVADSLPLCEGIALEGSSIEFYARTDVNNTLVRKNRFNSAEGLPLPLMLNGNLLYLTDRRDSEGIFILKESPVSGDRRPEVEHDFVIEEGRVAVFGWGIRPEEVLPTRWRHSYAVAIGVYRGNEDEGILGLKEYQMSRYRLLPERDYFIMANPWGDGHCYERLSEGFVLQELEACAHIGATHYQIDDGWQQGKALIRLMNNEVITDDYWAIDNDRFPNSFTPLAKRAGELGIKLALWFAPDRHRHYRNYQRDAGILREMHRRFGISTFKIDALNIQTKEAEENLEALLKELVDKEGDEFSFNFDATGALDRRPGYFYLQEYGNIFLENRYTRGGDASAKRYYPFRTLRNFWQLASYVLPQKLQIEFLNITLNQNNYSPDDELAPWRYSWEYCFAITFFANPLLWGEPSAFPEEGVSRLRPLIDLHKGYRDAIFACNIFPIGDMPDGYSWTGFQAHPRGKVEGENKGVLSVAKGGSSQERDDGFVMIFREKHPADKRRMEMKLLREGSYEFELVTSSAGAPGRLLSDSGCVDFSLDAPDSFAFYRYRRVG